MTDTVPPSRQALGEAIALSDEILRNIELSELPLAAIALKASRLARLLNESDYQKAFEYEAGGYPSTAGGIPPDAWALAVIAGRRYEEKEKKTEEVKNYVYIHSIAEIEEAIRMGNASLGAARDPNVSVSSSNPNQVVWNPLGNQRERDAIRRNVTLNVRRLASRRSFIHQYATRKLYELKFSGIADDIFSRIRERVDASVGSVVPSSVQKFTAVYENLASDNPEDWSNAVHSCRRILQDLADVIYPPQDDRILEVGKKKTTIKLGSENYINRLVAFIEENSDSERFHSVVGSQLKFIGERLDALFRAAQKGSHAMISDRAEADRYVVYTYMVVGDILSLAPLSLTADRSAE
jgi:hypothetical protein